MRIASKFPLLSLAAASTLGFAGVAGAQEITGAGASFPAPIYSKWASEYNKATGVKVNYQSIGSGGGRGRAGVGRQTYWSPRYSLDKSL